MRCENEIKSAQKNGVCLSLAGWSIPLPHFLSRDVSNNATIGPTLYKIAFLIYVVLDTCSYYEEEFIFVPKMILFSCVAAADFPLLNCDKFCRRRSKCCSLFCFPKIHYKWNSRAPCFEEVGSLIEQDAGTGSGSPGRRPHFCAEIQHGSDARRKHVWVINEAVSDKCRWGQLPVHWKHCTVVDECAMWSVLSKLFQVGLSTICQINATAVSLSVSATSAAFILVFPCSYDTVNSHSRFSLWFYLTNNCSIMLKVCDYDNHIILKSYLIIWLYYLGSLSRRMKHNFVDIWSKVYIYLYCIMWRIIYYSKPFI